MNNGIANAEIIDSDDFNSWNYTTGTLQSYNDDLVESGATTNYFLKSSDNEGVRSDVPFIRESFSGYTAGSLNGQPYKGTGEQPGGTWNTTNDNATIVTGESLHYPGWESAPGYLIVNNSEAEMTLDQDVLLAAKLCDVNGDYGGSDVQGTVYFGFLLNGNDSPRYNWSGGAELFRDNEEVLGLGQVSSFTAFSGFIRNSGSFNFDLNSANHEPERKYELVDSDDHLIIARIDFMPDATDILTVYFDPDLTLSEAEQPDELKKVITGYNLAFDEIRFRNGNVDWYYDEFRMALTWESLLMVPEPSTWALLILGAVGLMYVRKRTRK